MNKLIILSIILFPLTNYAQWINTTHGGAFDDNPIHLAMTISSNYAFAFRCTENGEIEAAFITPEKVENDTVDTLNALNSEMLFRVDTNDIVRLNTVAQKTDEGQLGFYATASTDMLNQIITANRRMAIAIQSFGQTFHEKEFSVSNSTVTGNTLVEKCSLE